MLNHANQAARLVLGALYLRKAQALPGQPGLSSARLAKEALEQVLREAPAYARTYGPRLEEARTLMAKGGVTQP